ncbi:Uncharacterised protein [Yersinia frederiksenii]|uniref:Uncharacterized protein n=1 Tax=Yersinia frederiksenii TaxID=29484 RepID=A0AAI8ZUP7_YERFR|nr:Uncharacterised protein [Yersinia frederiksenii]
MIGKDKTTTKPKRHFNWRYIQTRRAHLLYIGGLQQDLSHQKLLNYQDYLNLFLLHLVIIEK